MGAYRNNVRVYLVTLAQAHAHDGALQLSGYAHLDLCGIRWDSKTSETHVFPVFSDTPELVPLYS